MTVTVTDRAGLAGVLRQLKLSGMLATLDARLAQAAAGDLGHSRLRSRASAVYVDRDKVPGCGISHKTETDRLVLGSRLASEQLCCRGFLPEAVPHATISR
jgi:hypothetical protein